MKLKGIYNLFSNDLVDNKYSEENVKETVNLDGDYDVNAFVHPDFENFEAYEHEEVYNCQSVYTYGEVLYRKDTENINELIEKFMFCTYTKFNDVTKIDKPDEQMMWGTICPTKKWLFEYKSKIFIAYGRYIFGYDSKHVLFKKKKTKDESIDEPKEILNEVKVHANFLEQYEIKSCGDHFYAFMIYDSKTKVLDAFGLYK